MISVLFERGTRSFVVACVLTLVVAALHTLGIANDQLPNAEWASAVDAMRHATVEAGPFSFSLYGVFASVWVQMGALLAMFAGKNLLLVCVIAAEDRSRVVRALSLFDAACYGALTALFLYFRIPPPLVSFALLTLAFLTAVVLAGRSSPSPT